MKLQVLLGAALAGYCPVEAVKLVDEKTVKLADTAGAKDLPFKDEWYTAAGFERDGNGRWVNALASVGAHQACNWQCYLDRNPDLQRAYGPHNVAAAEKHWHDFGRAERRDCSCQPTAQLAATASNAKEASPCADNEGDSCDCKGTVFFGRKYRMGTPGYGDLTNLEQLKQHGFVEKKSWGRVTCSAAAMGKDPVENQFKYCLCASSQHVARRPTVAAARPVPRAPWSVAAARPVPPSPQKKPPAAPIPPAVTVQLPPGPGFADKTSISLGKVLLFMTTYGPPAHMSMLKGWPTVMKGQPMLSSADVFLYACGDQDKTKEIHLPDKEVFEEILGHFPNKNKKLYYTYDNPGYQTGAVKAAFLGFKEGWFKDYDWVIRLNTDVLIYDERELVQLMSNPNKDLVLNSCWDSNCESRCLGRMVMTDMFVMRPKALPANAFANWQHTFNAERATTYQFAQLVSKGRDSWLDRENRDRACRTRGHGIWHENVNFENLWGRKPWQHR